MSESILELLKLSGVTDTSLSRKAMLAAFRFGEVVVVQCFKHKM
jgi:hypothetical protein